MWSWLERFIPSARHTGIPRGYLAVRMQIRHLACNLDCPYCAKRSVRRGQRGRTDVDRYAAMLERLRELPRRLCLHLGVEGEIFTSPELLREVQKLCNEPNNVWGVSLLSNIHADWDRVIGPFLDHVDTTRLGIGCTLHDIVIPDVPAFFRKVERLGRHGVPAYVTYVAIPPRLDAMSEYKKRCEGIGVPFVPNALIGHTSGVPGVMPSRRYPYEYTSAEVERLRELWDTTHSFKMLVEACSPAGMRCSAGHEYVFVSNRGEVFPCSRIKTSLGNLLDGPIQLRGADTVCPSDSCFCGNQNQALRIVDRYYVRGRNIRLFSPKPGLSANDLERGYNAPPPRRVADRAKE